MKITKELLKEKNACSEGYEWFLNQEDTDAVKLIKKLNEENHFDWANWLLTRLFNKDDNIRYAIYAAELVLYIFEEKYPNDERPRKAIKATKDYLKNKDSNAAAASAAAYDAAYVVAAYVAASYAAAAASAAAYDAAATAYAAAADATAAYAAAAATAYAATAYAATAYAAAYAASGIKDKIIEYGISLLQKEGE